MARLSALVVTGALLSSVYRPVEAAAQPTWLTRVNQHRASAGVPLATENINATAGSAAHSRYLVLNREIGHDEQPGKPGYTEIGRRAGLTGNVAAGSGKVPTDTALIDTWMTVPFHGVGVIGPANTSMGFGTAKRGANWAATQSLFFNDFIDANDETSGDSVLEGALEAVYAYDPSLKGKGWSANGNVSKVTVIIEGRTFLVRNGVVSETTGKPEASATTVWPGNKQSVSLLGYAGSEWPDPLSSCPGYTSKAGLPLYILRDRSTELRAATMSDGSGKSLPLCIISAQTFKGRDAGSQQTGRDVLDSYGAVVLFPKQRLVVGSTYSVTAETTDGERVAWSFTTAAK
jgi:Cysteine-rich secretory protein family